MRPSASDPRELRLHDGRRLVYTEAGPADGVPVVYCHGAIGTPLHGSVDLESVAWGLGVRHISISRPGIGGSDPAPGRSVLDFAGDVRELADALELERLSVVGVSAGGPYALAIGHSLSPRVDRVAVCSSLSPLCAPHQTPGMKWRVRLALGFLALAPGLCSAVGESALPVIRRHPALLSRVIAAHAAPSERERFGRSDAQCAASASFLDASASGVRGLVDDYLTYSRGWGFSTADVGVEVDLWHGLNDPLVPVEHALQLASTLPSCRVFFDPNEGHHFFRRRLAEILGLLVSRRDEVGGRVARSVADARELAVGRRRTAE
jgi:pimeloyl-ACP methyl ester carboxylesterase